MISGFSTNIIVFCPLHCFLDKGELDYRTKILIKIVFIPKHFGLNFQKFDNISAIQVNKTATGQRHIQNPKMECFTLCPEPLIIFAKCSILYVSEGSEYVSDSFTIKKTMVVGRVVMTSPTAEHISISFFQSNSRHFFKKS